MLAATLLVLLGVLLPLGAPALEARAQERQRQATPARPCSLDAAEERYLSGAFDRAARLASRCLQQGEPLAEAQHARASRLLVLARLRQGNRQAARAAAAALLRATPSYTPDPVQDPPTYVAFVGELKREMRATGHLPPPEERRPWFERRRTWLAVGGGLLVAGLLAVFAGG